ncbi:MAG: glycosyltransferase family 4 protein [Acidimicrobiia bacterium]|nr:glycosyltransferase family 4 protein [Acidimicrobiia bacterium]
MGLGLLCAVLTVALDGTPLLGVRTGVARLVDGLIRALSAHGGLDLTAYAITLRGRHHLDDALPAGVRAGTAPIPARAAHTLWRHVSHPRIERWTGPVDVVHATNIVAPPVRQPTVVTVHDLTALRFPEMCTPDTLRYPDAIRRALDDGARVHTTTSFVAHEVSDEFGVPLDEIVRIPPGVDAPTAGDPTAGHALARTTRYLLALGTVEPRKNLPVLVQAFDELAGGDSDVQLVIAGPDGWGVEALDQAIAGARARARISRLGWVSSSQRADLLAGATAFVYPSLYEGFGFPPLEAMQHGIPVVAGDAGALPEVLGDAAVVTDPQDVAGLARALHETIEDTALRERLVAAGHERVARYTWDAAAVAFAQLYEEMA